MPLLCYHLKISVAVNQNQEKKVAIKKFSELSVLFPLNSVIPQNESEPAYFCAIELGVKLRNLLPVFLV